MADYNYIKDKKWWFKPEVLEEIRKFSLSFDEYLITKKKPREWRAADCFALRYKHSLNLKIAHEVSNIASCPSCGENKQQYKYSISYGHGDSTHEGWIECGNCETRTKSAGDWGHPTLMTKLQAYKNWNKWKK